MELGAFEDGVVGAVDEVVAVEKDLEVFDELGGQLAVAVDDVPELLNVEVCLRHGEIVAQWRVGCKGRFYLT